MKATEQGLRYVLVGIWNTLFGYGFFALLEITAGDVIPYMLVLLVSQAVATLVAYILYRYLVFKVRGHFWRDLGRFLVVYAAAFVVNLAVLPIFVTGLGWNVLASQALVVGGTVIATFFGNRHFAFRRAG